MASESLPGPEVGFRNCLLTHVFFPDEGTFFAGHQRTGAGVACFPHSPCSGLAFSFLFSFFPFLPFSWPLSLLLFDKGPCYVAWAGLNSWQPSCPSLLSAGTTNVYHHSYLPSSLPLSFPLFSPFSSSSPSLSSFFNSQLLPLYFLNLNPSIFLLCFSSTICKCQCNLSFFYSGL